jgi:uncharacterized protein
LTTIQFLDTSALTKLFVDEVASETLRSQMDALGDDSKAFSLLGQVEVRSALQRRLRNSEMSPDQHLAALSKLHEVSAAWLRIPIDEHVVEIATEVIARHALRSLDAIQLASALSVQEQLITGESLLFIACDKRLLTAASAEGLTIWNPETTSIPPAPPVN